MKTRRASEDAASPATESIGHIGVGTSLGGVWDRDQDDRPCSRCFGLTPDGCWIHGWVATPVVG